MPSVTQPSIPAQPPSRPFTTTPVTKLQGKRGLLIIIYGPPGVGKTVQAANTIQSPLASPGVLIDVESGVGSVTHMEDLLIADPAPKNWTDIKKITMYYRDTPKAVIEEKLLIFDNGAEISKMTLDHVVRDPSQGGGARVHPEIQHWGRATTEFQIWTRTLRDIAGDKDITIIMTCWDRRRGGGDESPDTESQPRQPKDVLSFNNRLAEELPGLVDIVGYMTVRPDGKRVLTFDASPRHSAKFRRNKHENARAIPANIIFGEDDAPIADIVNTIKGGKPFPAKYASRNPQAAQPTTQATTQPTQSSAK